MGKPRLSYSNGDGNSAAKRTTSGQFTQLNQAQVRELREAFNLLDKDGDGTINKSDLEEMLISLGQDPTDTYLEEMLSKMPNPLTFSSFLTGMSGHLSQVSSRQELLAAFEAFVGEDGQLHVEDLQDALVEYGFSPDQVKEATSSFTKHGFKGDVFNYKDFVDIIRASDD